jgi:CubicO group peptidase (beta-lactamase class C family)
MSIPVHAFSSQPARLCRRGLLAAGLSPLLLAACGGGADEPPPSNRLTVESSPRAKTAASQAVASGLAGLAIGRLQGNRLELGVAGRRRVGSAAELSGDELFCIGSNAKAMTALIAARLVELGRLRWDSRLLDVEPALRAHCLPAYASSTLADLLAHRSGVWSLTEWEELELLIEHFDGPLPETRAAQRLFLAAQVLALPPQEGVVPGRSFHYSNAGYHLAGLMLERAGADSFERLFERHVVAELGLAADLRAPALIDAQRQPWGHRGEPGALTPLTEVVPEYALFVDITAAAGVAALSPHAYADWLQLHLRALRGEATRLPAPYVQRLRTAAEGDYVLGWLCLRAAEGRRVLAHSGAEHGFTALVQLEADGSAARFALSNTQLADWVEEAMAGALSQLT